ncbi:MAG: NAD(P)-dependent oxidoreductase [Sulfuricurvum sp.]
MKNSLNIIGRGQLAQAFQSSILRNACIFVSGVSDSSCQETKEFERERSLLVETLKNNSDKKFVYFSSCALSAPNYPKNAYYDHKVNMEMLLKEYSNNYYIFRIPQLFGELKHHKTLINFLYESISKEESFKVYSDAYRYVVEIYDVRKLVEAYLLHYESCVSVDLANTYRYKVTEIIKIFEKLMGKKALYALIEKEDQYTLDLSVMLAFMKKLGIDTDFGEEYLMKKLAEKIALKSTK